MVHPVIRFVTYNVGNRHPPPDEDFVNELLDLHGNMPDIISFGTEEQPASMAERMHDLVDEKAGNKVGDKLGSWGEVVDEAVSQHGYYLVSKNTIYYTNLRVYAKKVHMPYISYVEAIDLPSGFIGGVSNVWKGAITVRFVFYGTSMAFINSHLSAHQEQTLNRNTEYWDNMIGQKFNDPATPTLYEHDYVFWTGDLNYRIDRENELVREKSLAGDISPLIPHDQLIKQKQMGLAFVDFEEAPINFLPTYKFNFDTNDFDTVKNRIPAWCDRVLVRVRDHRNIAAGLVNWGELELSDESSLSFSSSDIEEVTGIVKTPTKKKSKKKKLKKRRRRKTANAEEIAALPEKERVNKMRRKTLASMLRTYNGSRLIPTPERGTIPFDAACFTNQHVFEEWLRKVETRTKVLVEADPAYQTVTMRKYEGHPRVTMSDHKPVTCTMELKLVDIRVQPTLRFEHSEYTWRKGDKLVVHVKDGKANKKGRLKVMNSNWVDFYDNKVGEDKKVVLYEKKYKNLNPQKVTGGQVLTVEVPAEVHPGPKTTLSLVFVTGKDDYMTYADVTCE